MVVTRPFGGRYLGSSPSPAAHKIKRRMDIFYEVEKLNLRKNEFVVLGSGILAALGIRNADDIDLLIQPELFEKLKKEGW